MGTPTKEPARMNKNERTIRTQYWVLKDEMGCPQAISPSYGEMVKGKPDGWEVTPVMECQTHWAYKVAKVSALTVAILAPIILFLAAATGLVIVLKAL